MERQDGGDLPPADNAIRDSAHVAAEFLALANREVIDEAGDEALRDVMGADRILNSPVVVITPLAVPDRPALVFRSIVEGL